MKEENVIRYTFIPYFMGYFEEGSFYCEMGRKLEVKHYNGRNCITYKNKRFGIKKLRKFAKKQLVKKSEIPF